MRRGDDWDDFDDLDDTKRLSPATRTGWLTTRRIMIGLAVATVLAIIVGRMLVHQRPQTSEIPQPLIGLWTCTDQAKSDLYVEFERDRVMFGTGGTGSVKFRVLGSDMEMIGELRQYSVYYRDLAGTRHVRDVLLDPGGDTIRFAREPRVTYSRFSQ